MVKQLELIPRPRVRLDGPAKLAEADNAALRERHSDDDAGYSHSDEKPGFELIPDPFLGRSSWSKGEEKPPMTGWWEVTDHRTGTLLARWWFGGVWWTKGEDKGAAVLSHDQFVTQYAWRGLQRPHPDVYPCPPYASYALVERARPAGFSISTPYVRFKSAGPGHGTSETVNPPQYPTGLPRGAEVPAPQTKARVRL